ncbi:hypothetical protein SPRG_03646 [Saprolegnia parasitica CBS 223.65]|uniref:Thioredoxin domain-containing protein n=1 Tax=Saprolegnia parasitica (strain CBS 223.65) TaxID=695850 RepID=A0A067CM32_SAPPC|nr:hypothetical protein SPRG_03646 [Saprolegnia parasitica CBS 223.65]KDO31729.1 hypothetical protein SPRG_03646 [Saprolegnia parasitica CBS 223.65]|eukprot:XP_012197611.1 hypothetical protein SPRG_03646 [Saprolegnia parasitica CBS 223.65]
MRVKPSQRVTLLTLFRVSLAVLVTCSLMYMVRMYAATTSDAGPGRQELRLGQAPPLASQRVHAASFDEAIAYLSDVDLDAGPVYILVMSGMRGGDYWCGDCRNVKVPVAAAFAKAPPAARLLEVSVGTSPEWRDVSNPFRTHSLLRINHIPALLEYKGHLKTTNLVLEKFATDPELLEYLFRVPEPRVPIGARDKREVATVDALNAMVDAYDGSYPLYLFFVSGHDSDTERLWCPFCDSALLPVVYYFEHYAAKDAALVTVTTASTYDEWQDPSSPFRAQTRIKISGLPMLVRVMPNAAPLKEYTQFFEDRTHLVQFFQEPQPEM